MGETARPPEEDHQKELLRRWQTAKGFMPDLLAAVEFGGTEAAEPILEALDYLKGIGWKGRRSVDDAPVWVVSKGWQRLAVGEDGKVDRNKLGHKQRTVWLQRGLAEPEKFSIARATTKYPLR